ncbi:hypothetical protein J2Y69_000713 [Microbacterium resistens]|uniref:DUF2273 domain-containing protein n=1 Tax=Microbacterium resistens TaxID=156977 RepID=A0ABU1S940_9MICO|nr:hypothetical protein [Microbacterium resistens]MDR6866128.1 hypothetical protein [Microbacterium resistens]
MDNGSFLFGFWMLPAAFTILVVAVTILLGTAFLANHLIGMAVGGIIGLIRERSRTRGLRSDEPVDGTTEEPPHRRRPR